MQQLNVVILKPDEKPCLEPGKVFMGQLLMKQIFVLPNGTMSNQVSFCIELQDGNGCVFVAHVAKKLIVEAFEEKGKYLV